jgi:hypothetical protein
MKRLNFESFQKTEKSQLDGAYVFAGDACELCKMFEIELASVYGHRTQDWTVVETLLESDKDYVRAIAPEYKVCPFTAVFKGGEPVFQRNGVLYATQIQMAIDALKMEVK